MTTQPAGAGGPVRADRDGVGFLLNQAARTVRAQLAAELRLHGLDDADFIVLQYVMRSDQDPVAAAMIASELRIDPTLVGKTAERLARNGWLHSSGAGDALRLRPTTKAVSVLPGLQDTARWTLERALNGFSAEEIEALTGMLRRVIRNAGAPT